MKRWCLPLLILMTLAAWWAASTQDTTIVPDDEQMQEAAAYPADFEQRLRRVSGLKLEHNAPLPGQLPWQSAEAQPSPGDAGARKGGCVRLCNAGPFPAHFLRFGGGVPQFFHQNLNAACDIPLVSQHPLTDTPAAGVAEAWAVVGNTVYFRLNPAARYNNGSPVRAGDYLLAALLQAEHRCAEYEALVTAASALRSHGDHSLSISLRGEADAVSAARLLQAAEPAFYREFGSQFRESYAQRIPPSTGAYRVSYIERGRLIRLQRVQSWWGATLPLYRHRFNVDTLEYHFLCSEAQVWEFLLRDKLDAVQTRNILAWQEWAEPAEHLHRTVYEAEYPMPPYGIALNASTLPNLNLRRGLLYAMDMDRALAIMSRGEGQRLTTFHSGYGRLSPQQTPQYRYNPEQAREHFAQAGYTQSGTDGILQRTDGTRLSVRLLYTPHEKISTLMAEIIRSAAACGAEIVPEPVPWQICQRQLQERCHQMVFWAVPAPEKPAPESFFSPQADAPFCLDSPAMNQALADYAAHPDAETLAAVDAQVYAQAIWLPGWKENRVYIAHQPRLRLLPVHWCYDALDMHLFWVEPEP